MYTITVIPMQSHIIKRFDYPMEYTDLAISLSNFVEVCDSLNIDNYDSEMIKRMSIGDSIDAGGIGFDYRVELSFK